MSVNLSKLMTWVTWKTFTVSYFTGEDTKVVFSPLVPIFLNTENKKSNCKDQRLRIEWVGNHHHHHHRHQSEHLEGETGESVWMVFYLSFTFIHSFPSRASSGVVAFRYVLLSTWSRKLHLSVFFHFLRLLRSSIFFLYFFPVFSSLPHHLPLHPFPFISPFPLPLLTANPRTIPTTVYITENKLQYISNPKEDLQPENWFLVTVPRNTLYVQL